MAMSAVFPTPAQLELVVTAVIAVAAIVIMLVRGRHVE